MSIRLMSMVWDVKFPTQSQKLIALKLADYASDHGTSVFPSVNTIAEHTGCDDRTVQRVIKAFRDIGLLHLVRAGGTGPKATNEWAINLAVLTALSRQIATLTGSASTLEIEGDVMGDSKGDIMGDNLSSRVTNPDLRVTPVSAKGDTPTTQSFTNHQIDSSLARERAGDESASAPLTWKRSGLTQHVITDIDVQWSDWIKHLNACNRGDLAEAAMAAGEMTVVGSKWPTTSSKLPTVAGVGLSDLSKRIVGEVE